MRIILILLFFILDGAVGISHAAGIIARVQQMKAMKNQQSQRQYQQQYQAYQQQQQENQPQAQQAQAPDVEKIIEKKFAQQAAVQSLAQFEADAPQKYPHYETVKETMARLLEAGFAQDYPSAYQAAVRLPEHSELFDADLKQQAEAKAQETAKAQAEAALRARRNTVSPRTATPASTTGKSGKKDLRGELLDAWDQHAEAGRV